MSKDLPPPGEAAALRHRAEKHVANRIPHARDQSSEAHALRLLHELQVHQIELKLQNEELRASRAQVEAALLRFTDLYDFAPVSYFTLSVDGVIRNVNLPGARLLGLERARLTGGRFGAFVSQGSRPVFNSWLTEVFASLPKQTCPVTLNREGRSPLAVEIDATLSLDGLDARVVVVDVSARKVLEEQLRQAQKMEVVGQLAGGVAHDFNNILAAMIMKLEMLRMQHEMPEGAQAPLHDLDTLAKRAASLTRQLLLFSRQQAMRAVCLEVNAALDNLLKMLERLLGEHITCLRPANTPELWIEADPSMLDQAVMNLCINARDAMPNGGTLTLEASLVEFNASSVLADPESRPGQFVCLQISDTGCGMDADILQHVFEPFFTTKEIGKGTGLGLASAHGIVHQHKGWMNVKSVVGLGTSFRLFFPLSEKAVSAQITTPLPPVSSAQNRTILLVEDEKPLLHISTQALTMFGYRVLPAANGLDALKLWEQHRDSIDLLITDMRMPKGMNGLELAERIWKIKPTLKVIIMSGYSMEIAQNRTTETGYTFLAKPFGLKLLAETVRQCLV